MIDRRCHIHHDTRLICPRCVGARGGKKTRRLHLQKLREWGKLGGRPPQKK